MGHNNAVLIIFGATGDLAAKKILPALLQWYADETPFAKIWCFGRRSLDVESYISLIEKKGDFHLSKALKDKIAYHRLDFDNLEDYQAVTQRFTELEQPLGRLFFLAVKPEAFATITRYLHEAGLFEKGNTEHRLLFEKPFGESYKSALEIQSRLLENAEEEQIYRIDHYLGKEMIRNILAIRFANRIFSESWHGQAIETVEITSIETAGVEERLDYYDKAGAIDDMVQSHLLQMLALVAMAAPENFEAESIRRQKLDILRQVQLTPDCRPLIGQYQGYQEQLAGSQTETYVQAVLRVTVPAWQGTRFVLTTGKKLGEKRTRIRLLYRPNALCLSCQDTVNAVPNELVIEVYPREGILFTFNSKTPGYDYTMEQVNAEYCVSCRLDTDKPEAYVKLLKDALIGERTLFASFDELQVQWRIADQISAAARKGKMVVYSPGSMTVVDEEGSSC